jgi:hypothetical protein
MKNTIVTKEQDHTYYFRCRKLMNKSNFKLKLPTLTRSNNYHWYPYWIVSVYLVIWHMARYQFSCMNNSKFPHDNCFSSFHRRGVDKKVLQLMRDRTQGNTMTKVWRQIQENHCQLYLNRKDLYTTLLDMLNKSGGIVSALRHRFKPPPKRHELPSPRLLRHAFMLAEADNIHDYRAQILSTFGRVLKFDSTKKV